MTYREEIIPLPTIMGVDMGAADGDKSSVVEMQINYGQVFVKRTYSFDDEGVCPEIEADLARAVRDAEQAINDKMRASYGLGPDYANDKTIDGEFTRVDEPATFGIYRIKGVT